MKKHAMECNSEYLLEMRKKKAESDAFAKMCERVFSEESDPNLQLKYSAELARCAGVSEDKILKTVEDVDKLFLG